MTRTTTRVDQWIFGTVCSSYAVGPAVAALLLFALPAPV